MEETPETPVSFNVGDRLEVEIADMAFGGDGVGKVDGFVVFVPFVIVGELALVEITERKSDFARAVAANHHPLPRSRGSQVPIFRRMRRMPISTHRL